MRIAHRLSGKSRTALQETNFKTGSSVKDFTKHPGVPPRQNVRFAAGLLVGPADENSFRRKLKRQIPKCLK